ncbi:hypothetical protein [Kaistella flava (ex Peng et al. 2021)]|nr:hypothetical protein [Kaistella flava (ex Peng et al. 2021)]
MTPKQIERIQIKIGKIKKELAADKKRWGGFYDDSKGLRYLPPELYLKIQDYSGALRYFNWFNKNFPEDCGFPIFLLEWTITLFKKGKVENAEDKIIEVDDADGHLISAFLEIESDFQADSESSTWQTSSIAEYLLYSKNDVELLDFAEWLTAFVQTEKYTASHGR